MNIAVDQQTSNFSSPYLANYKKKNSIDLYKGLSGRFRKFLDNKARALGQVDRHALTMPRIFELCGRKFVDILELGCGNGTAISYKDHNLNYYAIDRSNEFKQELETSGIKFSMCDLAVNPIPLKNSSIDLVIMNHVIEHLPDPEGIVRELFRVLKPNGFAYIRTPDIKLVSQNFWDDYTHIKPYTPNSLSDVFQYFGF